MDRVCCLLLGVVLASVGCQRLPEAPQPAADDGAEGSTSGFPPAPDDPDADSTGTTGSPADPSVCVPGLAIDHWDDIEDLAGVEVFEASLYLDEGVTDEDLQWLQCLQRVEGHLVISNNPSLTSLHGLEALRSVGFDLSIRLDDALVEIDALAGVSAAGVVEVEYNELLERVDGLAGLVTANEVSITDNPRLESIHLPALTRTDRLSIGNNDALHDLDLAIEHVDDTLALSELPMLADLSGIASLEEVGETLSLGRLPQLGSIELPALRLASTSLVLADLPALVDVELPALERAMTLSVRHVPLLTALPLPSVQEVRWIDFADLASLVEPPDLTGTTTALREVSLTSIPGLSSLGWAGAVSPNPYRIALIDMASLSDLSALQEVRSVTTELALLDLPALTDLTGLASLEDVHSGILLQELPQITTLAPLSSLISAGEGLPAFTDSGVVVRDLDGLTNLAGLESLVLVGGSVVLDGNDGLLDLSGLEAIGRIEDGLFIVDHPQLTDIGALWPVPTGVLEHLGTGLVIENNPALSQCVVDEFVDAVVGTGWGGMPQTDGNLPCPG